MCVAGVNHSRWGGAFSSGALSFGAFSFDRRILVGGSTRGSKWGQWGPQWGSGAPAVGLLAVGLLAVGPLLAFSILVGEA